MERFAKMVSGATLVLPKVWARPVLWASLISCACPAVLMPTPSLAADIDVCFVPPQPCEERIVAAIGEASLTIRMQAYEFTSKPILAALLAAVKRGVDVQIIVDKVNERRRRSAALPAFEAGIAVWTDWQPAIAHNKIILVDGTTVIGGSFNYSWSAEHRNTENVLFIRDRDISAQFLGNWNSRRAQSRPWSPRWATPNPDDPATPHK